MAYGNRGNTVNALKRTESNAEFDRIRDALKRRTRAARQRPLRVPLLFFLRGIRGTSSRCPTRLNSAEASERWASR